MVPAGSVLTFDVLGAAGEYLPRSPQQVRSDVIAGLTPFVDVIALDITRATFAGDPLRFLSNWPYSAVITIRTRVVHGATDDLARVIAHACYEAAGELPTVRTRGFPPPPATGIGGIVLEGPSVGDVINPLATTINLGVIALAIVAVVAGVLFLRS